MGVAEVEFVLYVIAGVLQYVETVCRINSCNSTSKNLFMVGTVSRACLSTNAAPARLPLSRSFWKRRKLKPLCWKKNQALPVRELIRLCRVRHVAAHRHALIFSAVVAAIISIPTTSINLRSKQPF